MNSYQCVDKSVEACFGFLKGQRSGLTEKEAKKRLEQFGPNEIAIKKTTVFDILFRQVKSPFLYLLFFGGIITFAIGEKVDGVFIFSFIVINILLGFFQEYRSEQTVKYLKSYFSPKTTVLRNGLERVVDKKDIVSGDLILIKAGDIVSADIRLIETENLEIDESILSGESAPVKKTKDDVVLNKEEKSVFDATNLALSGTSVVNGDGIGIVLNTGMNTVFGEIAQQASKTKRESAYEKDILFFSKLVMKIVVSTILIIYIANLLIKGSSNLIEFSLFSIALIVSILPEALPTVVTFALTKGGFNLAKEKVVVRRMTAIEDLGNIEVLCTDKTGTLTENHLKLENTFSSDENRCFLYGMLASEAVGNHKAKLNVFDEAIFEKTEKDLKNKIDEYKLNGRVPFNSFRMIETFLIESKKGESILISKGAPEALLERSSKIEGGFTKSEILEKINKEGDNGRRVLGIAYKTFSKKEVSEEDENDFTFLGYFAFGDPLKPSTHMSLKRAEKLGVRVKILTGDSVEVSRYVGLKTGIITERDGVCEGKELLKMSDSEFDESCLKYDVFARVSPDLKLRIIKSLQKKYEVGFLGEGINDAPALKIANVGIVVSGASDISREVADIVLLEKNLNVIIKGVEEGRNIFNNINKYVKCTLASNFGNFYSIAIISLFIPFLPMLPVQILLGNLLSDFPLISVAGDYVDAEEMKKPKFSRLQKSLTIVTFFALVSTIFDLIFFSIFYKSAPEIIQTLWFIESVITEILLIYIIRTRHLFYKANRPSFQLAFFSVLAVVSAVAIPFSSFGQNVLHFAKPPVAGLLTVFGLLVGYFIVSEIVKLVYYRRVLKAV